MIQIVIADDHQMLIDGLKAMLEGEPDIAVVAVAYNGLEVLEILENTQVDVVLLDINMPVMDGVDTCKKMKKLHPLVNVLALTMYDEGGLISSMVKNGAKGYILKNTGKAELLAAIKAVHKGETFFPGKIKDILLTNMMGKKSQQSAFFIPKLTSREKEIITLIVHEFTTQEIADKLFISVKTVETHRKHLLQKLNVRNTAGLVRIAVEKGLVN
ncbi:MAG: response regulator transcription factor [Leptolyngbya sp. SIO1D8]|nr:response regulator transcription factor [Leptolyngbya sp. SIO1D8]